ncbi:hypothetical protein ACJJTC_007637 [Scirpophaga incertulas]
MASLDFSKLPIEEKALHVPPLEEIVDVLAKGLKTTFETVDVSVVDCPDLTQPPYYLTSPGLCGNETLVELGGIPYLVPTVQRDKLYDLRALLQARGRERALLAGAGAGPWPFTGVSAEAIVNLSVDGSEVRQGTRVVTVHPPGAPKGRSGYLQRTLPPEETRAALLGNYLLSDGAPGQVLQVVAKKRIGESNFITAIRETIKNHYGDKVVGLGGVFVLHEGTAKFHVMPDFSATPLCSDADVDGWLHYFEMRAPLVCLGTLVTGDLGLDLRVQHFHGYSAHGDGGHYHGDTAPARAHYAALLVPARAVLRVDRPPATHLLGRD